VALQRIYRLDDGVRRQAVPGEGLGGDHGSVGDTSPGGAKYCAAGVRNVVSDIEGRYLISTLTKNKSCCHRGSALAPMSRTDTNTIGLAGINLLPFLLLTPHPTIHHSTTVFGIRVFSSSSHSRFTDPRLHLDGTNLPSFFSFLTRARLFPLSTSAHHGLQQVLQSGRAARVSVESETCCPQVANFCRHAEPERVGPDAA